MDTIAAERSQLDILIEEGLKFSLPKRSLLRYIGKPERSFTIPPPYLGTLDFLSREFVDMDFSESALEEYQQAEARRLMARNTRRCAKILALAYLNARWKIGLFTPLLTRYFLWHVTPRKLLMLAVQIQAMSNLPDFTLSIRFLSVVSRTASPTIPVLVEKPAAVAA